MEAKKKKPYSKPQIYFEDFAPTCNIASSCEIKSNATIGVCGADIPGAKNVFMMGVSGCSPLYWNQTANGQYYSTCYTNHEGNNVFNS